jgi:phage/plasmid-associated DNA primase
MVKFLESYKKAGICTHSIKEGDKAPIWISPDYKEDPYWKEKVNCKNRLEAHNKSVHDSERIGYFTGLQPSGKWIITLDFDIFSSTDKNTQNKFVYDEFKKALEFFEYPFQSSTCGNYGMIIDITESQKIQQLIKEDGRQKIDVNGLEILFNGTNSILPPTITPCKRHNKECQERGFRRAFKYNRDSKKVNNLDDDYLLQSVRIFEIYDDENDREDSDNSKFHKWFNNIMELSKQKKTKTKEVKEPKTKEVKEVKETKEVNNDDEENETILNNLVKKEKKKKENIEKKKKETKEKTQKLKETIANKLLGKDDINEKMLRHLLDCITDERFNNYNEWFKLSTIIKNAFGSDYYDIFDEYNKKYKGYDKVKNKEIWDKIKLEKYNIGYLVYLAKEDNPEKYKEYQKLFNTDLIINEKTISDYIHTYNNNFIIQDNILYYFNNRIWVYGKTAENYMKGYISNDLYMFILSDILINYASTKQYVELVKDLQKYCMTTKHKEQVIKTLFESKPTFGNSNKIIFDINEEIFMFTNGCYDLTTIENKETKKKTTIDKFIYCSKDNIDYFRSLYITLDCGYNYEKPTKEETEFMNSLLNKILLNEEHKNKFLEIISTGLIAKLIQKMHIFLGGGGNGKSLIMEYVKQALGNYYVNGEVELIMTNSKKTSTAEASLHNKRLCCLTEPDSGERKISNSHFKGLIGEKEITGKLLYENTGCKNNNNTFIILTNDMPKFKTNVSNGEIRRIDVVKFNATFTDNISLVDNKTVFKADDSLTNTETQIKYRHAFFYILTQSYKEYKQRNFTALRVDEFEKEKKDYIAKSETTLQNIFNLIEEDSTKYIKIKNLYDRIRETESYDLMTSTEKKKFTKENLNKYIETNILFKNKYTEIKDCKCLLNFKFKLPEREDFEDIDDYNNEVERIQELNYNINK